MSEFEKKTLEREFSTFARRNFEKPKKCRDLEQIRFYVNELSLQMEELKSRCNYVPKAAYTLLAQYNAIQNRMVFANFKNSY